MTAANCKSSVPKSGRLSVSARPGNAPIITHGETAGCEPFDPSGEDRPPTRAPTYVPRSGVGHPARDQRLIDNLP